jgi:dipeptidyl aminopeptidase/acylaminoacyl peptidase
VIYPEEGHGVSRFPAITDYLTRLVTWLERYMPAEQPGHAGQAD